jgi:hypothetical protein
MNVSSLAATSDIKDRYLETGRSFMVSATLKW